MTAYFETKKNEWFSFKSLGSKIQEVGSGQKGLPGFIIGLFSKKS
jgi:hypothetical protein